VSNRPVVLVPAERATNISHEKNFVPKSPKSCRADSNPEVQSAQLQIANMHLLY
jgi:hypothetical protein